MWRCSRVAKRAFEASFRSALFLRRFYLKFAILPIDAICFSSLFALTKFVPLSLQTVDGWPRLAMNRVLHSDMSVSSETPFQVVWPLQTGRLRHIPIFSRSYSSPLMAQGNPFQHKLKEFNFLHSLARLVWFWCSARQFQGLIFVAVHLSYFQHLAGSCPNDISASSVVS